ncbi:MULTISPECIES: hypothetical protein [Paenibacillus]|uniref:Uncharacterized protein n=1 Tax=Paenibacillus lactis TaxID=228574 RepID=A0ABS4FI44_9BACL|nr:MULTISPECIES: hypothetical protein [Paenibacillus]MBP1895934.1 hypothetical protein [Paenibacillus lactis]MEC0258639.1 hypothetical protein [Paenibacillus lautus]
MKVKKVTRIGQINAIPKAFCREASYIKASRPITASDNNTSSHVNQKAACQQRFHLPSEGILIRNAKQAPQMDG